MKSWRGAVLAASIAALALAQGASGDGRDAVMHRGDRYVPKAPGTVEDLQFYFGPYEVPPGHDSNRVDIDLPLANGFILSVEPSLRRSSDLSEPVHQLAHIHHAHWFRFDPGNKEDNYLRHNGEWIFGNGDEETKADFRPRTNADPKGPVYGQYIGADGPQAMIFMLHNKTSQPLNAYVVLDVTFEHGTPSQLEAVTHRPHHDLSGVLFGRTFDVPRRPRGDGTYETAEDDPRGPIEWTSTLDGTIIGTGGHLHPGGIEVIVENYGSKSHHCGATAGGYGGTVLLRSKALFRNAPFSEDFQMSVSDPAWRAPIHKGDRIRLSGTYENKDHAWYEVMTHEGFYIDPKQAPAGGCAPYFVGGAKGAGVSPADPKAAKRARRREARRRRRLIRRCVARRVRVARKRHGRLSARRKTRLRRRCTARYRKKRAQQIAPRAPDPTVGVPSRPFGPKPDPFCGEAFGARRCERPYRDRGPGMETSTVTIAKFVYTPGDRGLSGKMGAPARVRQGRALTFFNADQQAGIRHTVTTCRWPCNGTYVANYPFADGVWDSGVLGYDPVSQGSPNPIATTPRNLPAGKYSYFCRIHPWMRGAFEVVD